MKDWDQICAAAAANARRAWDRITADPGERAYRQHPLKGSLGTRSVDGVDLEQWQFEVTSAGRISYCIDDARRTDWMTDCSIGHPEATEWEPSILGDHHPLWGGFVSRAELEQAIERANRSSAVPISTSKFLALTECSIEKWRSATSTPTTSGSGARYPARPQTKVRNE